MFKSGFTLKTLVLLGLPSLVCAQFKYWNVEDTASIPKLLSQTGLYTGTSITTTKKIVVANAYHFDVNSALWSDDAHKSRWAMVKAGKSIGFKLTDDYWTYPDSTVFIKEFDIDTIVGDTTSRIKYETRFLVSKKEIADTSVHPPVIMDRWYGYSYKWNKDQKDAQLVVKKGMNDTIRVWPNGYGPGKTSVMKKWVFPGRNQCEQCHRIDYADTVHGRSVLGFFTAQLNRPHPDSANINQLQYFFNKGLLTGTKPASWTAAGVPKWAAITDSTATLDLRARSYIAANCSGCHGRRGMETGATFGVSLNYDFFDMTSQMEFRNRSVSWPFGLDTLPPFFYAKTDLVVNPTGSDTMPIVPALVVPGYPMKSVILFRQTSRNTKPGDWDPDRNQMPPLASFEVNVTATNLLSQWIKNMAPAPLTGIIAFHGGNIRTLLKSPFIEGRTLRLPPELAGQGNVKVAITGITGRTLQLQQIGHGVYSIPANLSAGVYQIRVGSQSFTRYMF